MIYGRAIHDTLECELNIDATPRETRAREESRRVFASTASAAVSLVALVALSLARDGASDDDASRV